MSDVNVPADQQSDTFCVGVSPDFYADAKGRFESVLAESLNLPGIRWEAMPELEGNVASPEVLNRYDAVFALAMRVTAESLAGVERLAIIARWGVGYDKLDVAAMTAANVVLAITPNAVRTPVAEAILTLILALAKNLLCRIEPRVSASGGATCRSWDATCEARFWAPLDSATSAPRCFVLHGPLGSHECSHTIRMPNQAMLLNSEWN